MTNTSEQWVERLESHRPKDVGVIVDETEDRIRVLWRGSKRRSWIEKYGENKRWRRITKPEE